MTRAYVSMRISEYPPWAESSLKGFTKLLENRSPPLHTIINTASSLEQSYTGMPSQPALSYFLPWCSLLFSHQVHATP